MDWSPNDRRADLLAACEERGIDVKRNASRSKLISLLKSFDAQQTVEVKDNFMDGVDTVYVFTSDGDQATPEAPEPEKAPDPPPSTPQPVSTAPVEAQPPSESSDSNPKEGILCYLQAFGGRVLFEDLIKDCGPEAKELVKELVADRKVIQYKQHNKFWFEAK